ncbi:Oidioi.mRNA.OKI2018_I69.XSR.g13639.t1.cds [Oikopleura dioica]|uniref:Oidioi.mRNA.OKI2018_I69.XSR.g13639.t1.cds n=1 Tax=Oikopleura dioica TaxID=34765 RepID=A0ABN7S7Y5_OIKDI|nr:Oidioi.mRNA.OKI2018_I69.XSR.g13639.t1.cds [Oikopleura dioica]
MSALLLDQLNERDELVNAIQLKNRFISFVHRVEEVSKSSREGRMNTIRGILKSLHVPVPTTLSPHPSTLVIPYIPENGIPSDEQLEALCRCLEAMASNSRVAPTLLAKYICSVYLE